MKMHIKLYLLSFFLTLKGMCCAYIFDFPVNNLCWKYLYISIYFYGYIAIYQVKVTFYPCHILQSVSVKTSWDINSIYGLHMHFKIRFAPKQTLNCIVSELFEYALACIFLVPIFYQWICSMDCHWISK